MMMMILPLLLPLLLLLLFLLLLLIIIFTIIIIVTIIIIQNCEGIVDIMNQSSLRKLEFIDPLLCNLLNPSQTTILRLFQTEGVCRLQF